MSNANKVNCSSYGSIEQLVRQYRILITYSSEMSSARFKVFHDRICVKVLLMLKFAAAIKILHSNAFNYIKEITVSPVYDKHTS